MDRPAWRPPAQRELRTDEPSEAAGICPSCRSHVVADEVAHVIYNDGPAAPNWRFSILLCRSCGGPLVLYGEDGDSFTEPNWLYPLMDGIHPSVPNDLRIEMTEAITLAASGHPLPAALLCGRTLEGLARLHNIHERTLHKSLTVLEQRGLISSAMLTWASELRALRNVAAHYGARSAITAQDADDAIALTVAILDYVYVFARRFEDFKARRDNPREGRD